MGDLLSSRSRILSDKVATPEATLSAGLQVSQCTLTALLGLFGPVHPKIKGAMGSVVKSWTLPVETALS